jgi:hypothetical protein
MRFTTTRAETSWTLTRPPGVSHSAAADPLEQHVLTELDR